EIAADFTLQTKNEERRTPIDGGSAFDAALYIELRKRFLLQIGLLAQPRSIAYAISGRKPRCGTSQSQGIFRRRLQLNESLSVQLLTAALSQLLMANCQLRFFVTPV